MSAVRLYSVLNHCCFLLLVQIICLYVNNIVFRNMNIVVYPFYDFSFYTHNFIFLLYPGCDQL